MNGVAASLLGLGTVTAGGTPWSAATMRDWEHALLPLREAGYSSIELPTTWVDPASDRRAELVALLRDLDVTPAGILVARRSVIDPTHAIDNLEYTHDLIDAAAEMGVGVVCTGLHSALSEEGASALWFWTAPDPVPDPDLWPLAVAAVRELARHAGAVGVELSLELYERTFVGDASEAARFVEDVDHPACGINADLGNLQRAPEPVIAWEQMLQAVLPHMNYWHLKNCMRVEDPGRDLYLAWPTELAAGLIDYRRAIEVAVEAGYDGPMIVEHYGGDAIGALSRAHPYVSDLVRHATTPRRETVEREEN